MRMLLVQNGKRKKQGRNHFRYGPSMAMLGITAYISPNVVGINLGTVQRRGCAYLKFDWLQNCIFLIKLKINPFENA